MFGEVSPSPSLPEDFLRLRKHAVGDESRKLVFKDKIHVIDAFKPRTSTEIQSDKLQFGGITACVNVKGVLFTFQCNESDKKVTCIKYENAYEAEAMVVTAMPKLPFYRELFSVCVIKSRFVLLIGGHDIDRK